MSDDDIVEKIRKKYERLSGVLDERSRRCGRRQKPKRSVMVGKAL